MNKSVLKESLTRCLKELAIEDMKEHGRLLTLKQQLLE
jgi:hypothetical protein